MLCVGLSPAYISGNASMKSSTDRTKGAFRFVSCLADGYINTLLPFSYLTFSYRFVHDATLEFHTFKYALILGRVITFVCISRGALWKSCEAAERETVIHLFFYLIVAQSMPYTKKFRLEQNYVVVTWTAG